MFYCILKGKSCPHLKKVTRTIIPKKIGNRRGTCLVCSKLPRTKNIVQVIEVFDGGPPLNLYHYATYCPEK